MISDIGTAEVVARFGPTTPQSGTRAGVRLAAIGKGVKSASYWGRIPSSPWALSVRFINSESDQQVQERSPRTGRAAGQG